MNWKWVDITEDYNKEIERFWGRTDLEALKVKTRTDTETIEEYTESVYVFRDSALIREFIKQSGLTNDITCFCEHDCCGHLTGGGYINGSRNGLIFVYRHTNRNY